MSGGDGVTAGGYSVSLGGIKIFLKLNVMGAKLSVTIQKTIELYGHDVYIFYAM